MMHSKILLLPLLLILAATAYTQDNEDCNELGVWLWHLEYTGFPTHSHLAKHLEEMNVKRVYVKVSDGFADPEYWPEMIDKSLVQAYHNEGLEVWGWSYNYKNNSDAQAEALYLSAETGYDGYVVDVEMEFDGDSSHIACLFSAFYDAKQDAIDDGLIAEDFPLYCTTWGNPILHNFRIDVIDPFVDGYMPQTYVEVWGSEYLENIQNYVNLTKEEYEYLGATKPIHSICATQEGIITADQINEFIANAGPETSLWRVPGGGVPQSVWDEWDNVKWDMNFCTNTKVVKGKIDIKIFPNPTSDKIAIQSTEFIQSVNVYNSIGQCIIQNHTPLNQKTNITIDMNSIDNGIYWVEVITSDVRQVEKVIKL